MSRKELIAHELENASEEDLDVLLRFIRSLKFKHVAGTPELFAETSLAKDWLKPEEEVAWADL